MDPSHLANLGNITLVLKQIALAFIPVTCVAVSLRVYVRVAVVRGFGLDDLMLLVAQVRLFQRSINDNVLNDVWIYRANKTSFFSWPFAASLFG
jgi:hypothetical protein